jgi:acetolactate synthase-1/2/3 large subunit
MKKPISVADYLIKFLIEKGITDVFGYQGGMVCHIFDSLGLFSDRITYHSCGNEQGASFAACGYAQATGKMGVIITTSGPGFTNALTGLANAWFDSIPVMLISGQVNTKDKRREMTLRQFGFQEIQAVEIAKPIVKKVYEIDVETDIKKCLEDAYKTAFSERKGPVYLDIPINIEREIIEEDYIADTHYDNVNSIDTSNYMMDLLNAKKPIIIAGNGIKQCGMKTEFRTLIKMLEIPVITTLPAIDLLPTNSRFNVGYLGGTARRDAGIVLANTDFVLCLGTRVCNKAIGYDHSQFVPKAKKVVRVDVDTNEFERNLKECEEQVVADLRAFIPDAIERVKKISKTSNHKAWVESICDMKKLLSSYDLTFGNELVRELTSKFPSNANIVFDVGNNLIYGAQSTIIKENTRIYVSAGLGSMGYSIPAAVGACIGNNIITYSFSGDGGAQMNIQELNIISKLNLPVKLIILNNKALGHIILFQEHYLDNRLIATTEKNNDYYSCDFAAIANAYGIRGYKVREVSELSKYTNELLDEQPALFEIEFENCTMLPNIHGGLDCLSNGPQLPVEVIEKIKRLME